MHHKLVKRLTEKLREQPETSNNDSNVLQNKVMLEPEKQQSNLLVSCSLGERNSSGCDWEEVVYAMEM